MADKEPKFMMPGGSKVDTIWIDDIPEGCMEVSAKDIYEAIKFKKQFESNITDRQFEVMVMDEISKSKDKKS